MKKFGNRKVPPEECWYYLSAWGNENILRNHVAYFENKINEEIAVCENEGIKESLAHHPKFAVWIRLFSELICNLLFWKLLRSEGAWARFEKMKFAVAKKELFSIIDQQIPFFSKKSEAYDVDKMKESFELILDIRHSFQHGGLPNLMRKLEYCQDPKKFQEMLNPKNYKETKKMFLEAEKLLKLLPNPIVRFMKKA